MAKLWLGIGLKLKKIEKYNLWQDFGQGLIKKNRETKTFLVGKSIKIRAGIEKKHTF